MFPCGNIFLYGSSKNTLSLNMLLLNPEGKVACLYRCQREHSNLEFLVVLVAGWELSRVLHERLRIVSFFWDSM